MSPAPRLGRSVACLLSLCAVAVLSLATVAQAQTQPALFRDHMVLQRGKAIPVWGSAEPGAAITVTLADATATATADADGHWRVDLPAMTAGGPHTLTVAGDKTLTYEDVLIGDVWLCSGQSNMEWNLGRVDEHEVKTADHPGIRFFAVHNRQDVGPNDQIRGNWNVIQPGKIGGVTAVGYFFGRTLHQASDVPIGLIQAEWGGTRIETWLAPERIADYPELAYIEENRQKADTRYRQQIPRVLKQIDAWKAASEAALESGGPLPTMPWMPNHPGLVAGNPNATPYNLYYGMIQPLIPTQIAGVIWYQGESNGGEGDIYLTKLKALAQGYRQDFRDPELPVYIVQLANFQGPNPNPAGGNGWAKVRDAQRKFLTVPRTGLAVAIDIGEANDIHPRNKEDVGKRLAQWALRDVYGQTDVVVSGPLYTKVTPEGGSIRVHFDHADGLMTATKTGTAAPVAAPGATPTQFAIAGEDKVWHWAEATIDGQTVVLRADGVAAPVAVRYAFQMNPEGVNLYNAAGLPAVPFRSDDW